MTINDTLETCATCRFHDIPALYSCKGNTEEPRAWGYCRRHAPTKWEVKSPYERLERLGISPDQKLRGLKQLKEAGLVDYESCSGKSLHISLRVNPGTEV